MPFPDALSKRTVAGVLAACSTSGCTMIGALDLSSPVLPGTLVAILVLLGGMFAVAWVRYAHRGATSETGAPGRTDNVT
jgi:hypothetical protein